MERDIEKILITEEEIQAKVRELGEILTEEYKDKNGDSISYKFKTTGKMVG